MKRHPTHVYWNGFEWRCCNPRSHSSGYGSTPFAAWRHWCRLNSLGMLSRDRACGAVLNKEQIHRRRCA